MKEYQIISDGACDLEDSYIAASQIKIIPFYISFDGENYIRERTEMSVKQMYDRMVGEPKNFPKTSMPAVEDYARVFREVIKEGKDVLCISTTSKMSGAFNSANVAKLTVQDEFPDARIEVIDSRLMTGVQGLYVRQIVEMQKAGLTLDETLAKMAAIQGTGRIYFTVGDLDYLAHGGRIGKVTSIIGSTLKIKPLIEFREGEIFAKGISLSRRRSMLKLVSLMQDYFKKNKENPGNFMANIGCGYDTQEVIFLQQKLKEVFPELGEVPIFQIGATIAVHTGPYPTGVCLIKRWDRL